MSHEDKPVRLRRRGETRFYVVADATCIGSDCFDPVDVLLVSGASQHGTCRHLLRQGKCPAMGDRGYSLIRAGRRATDQGWTLEDIP